MEAKDIPTKVILHATHIMEDGNEVMNPNDDMNVIVLDVTFVDDEAIAITASVPKTVLNKAKTAVQSLVTHLCLLWHDHQLG